MHPILFQVGGFYVGTYGLMLAIAMICGSAIAIWRGKQVGVDSSVIMDLLFFCVIGGIVGGRIAHIIVNFDEFQADPLGVTFSRMGFVFLGSLIGGVAVVVFIVVRRKLNFWILADALACALPLSHMFGRIGCHLAGCCYGRVIDPEGPLGFLAVQFPRATMMDDLPIGGQAFYAHTVSHGLNPAGTLSLPVFPVQLFESFGNLILFFALLLLWRFRKFQGQVFLAYLMLYSVLRFSLEFLRGDEERGAIAILSTSQFLSLLALGFAVIAWIKLRKKGLPEVATVTVAKETEKARPSPSRKKKKK